MDIHTSSCRFVFLFLLQWLLFVLSAIPIFVTPLATKWKSWCPTTNSVIRTQCDNDESIPLANLPNPFNQSISTTENIQQIKDNYLKLNIHNKYKKRIWNIMFSQYLIVYEFTWVVHDTLIIRRLFLLRGLTPLCGDISLQKIINGWDNCSAKMFPELPSCSAKTFPKHPHCSVEMCRTACNWTVPNMFGIKRYRTY